MPKELIYSDRKPFVISPDGGEHPVNQGVPVPEGTGTTIYRRGVHVGWARDRYVEVGVGVFSPSTEIGSDSHYASLDREGINRLIRSLRKARDAAFGADA